MELLALLDELRMMARTGLNYADDPYDRRRYDRMLELVSEYYGEALDEPPASVRESLADELGEVTPKVASLAAVFDDDGRILLMKRADTGRWCLPGGKLDAAETPEEGAVREVREETGLDVEVDDLVDTYARRPGEDTPYHVVALAYACERVGGDLEPSHEADALRYWELDAVPEWTADHRGIAEDARTHLRNGG